MIAVPRLGCRPSHPDKLRGKISGHLHPAIAQALKASALPPGIDLSGCSPDILDQGQSGSCTWASSSSAIYTAMRAAGTPISFIPSQRLGYAATRELERAAVTPSGALPALEDTGAELADVMTVLGRYGIAPMVVQQTPDGRLYDIWTDADTGAGTGNVNAEADLVELEIAGQKLVAGEYLIDPTTPEAPATVAASIAANMPVEVAFFCDLGFQNLQPGEVYGAPTGDPNNPKPGEGGHAVYLSSYTTNPDGSYTFGLTNSWGKIFCDGGRCLVSEAFVRSCWEAWPWAIARKS